MPIRYEALSTDLVRALQAGALDANGHAPERRVSDGAGNPCRHCLTDIAAGEPMLVLAHRPFSSVQPYSEQGPIFLHAEPCTRHDADTGMPSMFRERAGYLVRGYDRNDRIVYGSGFMVTPDALDARAADLLSQDGVAYLHVRSGSYNCYQCRIDRSPDA